MFADQGSSYSIFVIPYEYRSCLRTQATLKHGRFSVDTWKHSMSSLKNQTVAELSESS